jgi:O-antigen biosynthesis protein
MTRTGAKEVIRRIRVQGPGDVSRRVVRRVARDLTERFGTAALDFPLLPRDVADSTRLSMDPPASDRLPGSTLDLAWLCTPPGAGSGGHTTLFRMVKGMEDRGHTCTLLLYDRHGSDMSKTEAVIRKNWPWMHAKVSTVPNSIAGFDGCVASSWETAHVLASRGAAAMCRFYFIQDFEPYFYPRGSLYSLAEDSYRFGFRNIALGEMVAGAVRSNVGVAVDTVPFGCDGEVYDLQNQGPRRGVVFYAREQVDRRGFLLGKLALEEFHQRHPEQGIHVYGDQIGKWHIPHSHHGKLMPAELNELYNNCITGLALSFTNISLVAEEMLSSGMIPVVNDHPYARADLATPGVYWAPATPGGLADALCRAVETRLSASQLIDMTAGARKNWLSAQAATAGIIEAETACSLLPDFRAVTDRTIL